MILMLEKVYYVVMKVISLKMESQRKTRFVLKIIQVRNNIFHSNLLFKMIQNIIQCAIPNMCICYKKESL